MSWVSSIKKAHWAKKIFSLAFIGIKQMAKARVHGLERKIKINKHCISTLCWAFRNTGRQVRSCYPVGEQMSHIKVPKRSKKLQLGAKELLSMINPNSIWIS